MHQVQQRAWLVRPLDAHDAVEQLALEGIGELGMWRAAEELSIELERVVLRARLLVRVRVRVRARCKVRVRVRVRVRGKARCTVRL